MGTILRYREFLKTYKTRSYRIKHLQKYKSLFPIKANPILAGIIADLIGDGNLQENPKWRIDFTSKSKKELKRFEKELKKMFPVKGKIRKCSTNILGETFNLAVNCSPITRILFLCGVPSGQKVLKKFKIPKWILKDKNCFRMFCRRFFTCEGTIMHEPHRTYPQIRLNFWKSDKTLNNGLYFLTQIQKGMLKHFKIKSVIKVQKSRLNRKDGIITRPIRIYLFGESVVIFMKEIGFEGKKQKDLKAIIHSNSKAKTLASAGILNRKLKTY